MNTATGLTFAIPENEPAYEVEISLAENNSLNTAQKIADMITKVNLVQQAITELNSTTSASELNVILTKHASVLNLSLTDYNSLDSEHKSEVDKVVFNSGNDYGNAATIKSVFGNAVQRQKVFASIKVSDFKVHQSGVRGYIVWERISGTSVYNGFDRYEIFYVPSSSIQQGEILTKDTIGAGKVVSAYANSFSTNLGSLTNGEYKAVIYATDGTNYSTVSDVLTFTLQ